MKKIALLFMSLLILFSCGKNTGNDSDLEEIIISNENKVYLHEIVCDIEAIPLESSDELLIGNIDHLILTEDHIIVCDSYTSKSVYVFDRKGKHCSTINRLGRGPQEYTTIHHVALLPDNKTIAINDNYINKVLYYNMDGEFLSSTPTSFWFDFMEYIDNDNILCVTTYGLGKDDKGLFDLDDFEKTIFLTDDKYSLKKGFLSERYDRSKFRFNFHNFKKFNNDIWINLRYTDIIYKEEDYTLKPTYRFNLDKINGLGLLDPNITNEEFTQLRKEKATFSGRYAISDDYVILLVNMPGGIIETYLYSKETKRTYLIEKDRDYRDDLLVNLIGFIPTQINNRFVSHTEAQSIINRGKGLIEQQPELSGVKEDDNPVVILYKFKEGL